MQFHYALKYRNSIKRFQVFLKDFRPEVDNNNDL